MRAIWVIASTDLVRRLRNRSAIATAFVGPLAMAIVFSVLIGGAGHISFKVGLVDQDRSAISAAIIDGLVHPSASTRTAVTYVVRTDSEASVRRAVDDAALASAVVIPAGLGAAVNNGAPARLIVLLDPTRPLGGQIGASIANSVASRLTLPERALLTLAGVEARAPTDTERTAVGAAPFPLVLAAEPADQRAVTPAAFYGASMSILFLFFTVSFAARSMMTERRDGTMARILSTPTSLGQVMAGKTISVAVLGLSGLVTSWAVTTFGFGAHWGDPLAVFGLMVATVVSIAGVGMFVAGMARTEQQADSYTAAVTFVFALLGGNFIGPGAATGVLKTLELFTPDGWALRAFTRLAADEVGISAIAGSMAVLVAIGALFGSVAVVSAHKVAA